MTVWVTSDTHFSHANILKYCNRPFRDIDHMDEEIIKRWNECVDPDDIVYHLGDVALGPIDKSLPKVGRLNGHKRLVLGNHDRPFMRSGKGDFLDWLHRYEEVFEVVYPAKGLTIDLYGHEFYLSHFPYDGDSQGKDRYVDERPYDMGLPLIHGHTHSTDVVTYSKTGTLQIHVGMDAWGFTPVHENYILSLLGEYSIKTFLVQ